MAHLFYRLLATSFHQDVAGRSHLHTAKSRRAILTRAIGRAPRWKEDRQPAFVQLKQDRPQAFRVIGDLSGADEIMQRALFLGTYPGLTPAMLDYEIAVISAFVRSA